MTPEDLIAKMKGGEVTNKTEMCNKKVTNSKDMLGGKKSKWLLPRTVSTERIKQK